MENPHKNRETAEVFSRYIKRQLGLDYGVFLPKKQNDPDFDVRLDSEEHGSLLLQLKQLITFDSGENTLTRLKYKNFRLNSPESIVKIAEGKYKDRAKDLILILHVDDGYLIRSDAECVDKNNFTSSTFKGIYMVSPERKLFKAGEDTKIQEEFVSEIKNAFS